MRGFALIAGGLVVAAASATAQSMDGVWRTQGYGQVLVIKGSSLNAFEVTATTCVPTFTATVEPNAAPDRAVTFKTADGSVMFVRPGGSAEHKIVHHDGSASDLRIDRIPSVPGFCTPPTKDTPIDNFEVFARTWAENYILFDERKTDWSRVVEANRPRVTAKTTPAELFAIFEGMISPFHDAHTFIRAKSIDKQFRTLRVGTDRVAVKGGIEAFPTKGLPALVSITDQAYLKGPLRKWCNDQVQFGTVDDSTGYLRILSFSNFASSGGFAGGLAALEAALDTIFTAPKLRRLVIDVRINFGGADPYGLAIASRLANGEYLAYTKEARSDPVDRNKWTPGDKSIVRPSSRPGFRGPVVELIGPLTISAGETFTQALMGRRPTVIRIGEPTQGVFSDVLGRTLPNGWRFGLPNEVFRTASGTTFDGAGIPPDVSVPVFADPDVAAGKDPGMARALEILRTGQIK